MDSTWKQVERNVAKVGFRDGIEDGKDASCQKGFDDGYSEGFRIGRILGQTLGKQKVIEALGGTPSDTSPDASLDKPKLGACLICSQGEHYDTTKVILPDSIYQTSYEDIVTAQRQHNDSVAAKLNGTSRLENEDDPSGNVVR